VRRGEHVGQGDGGWGSPEKSVTGEAVWRRRSDGVSMTAAALGDRLGLLQHRGRKVRVRRTELKGGVAVEGAH
jgi:hypothetical protein